MSLLVFFFLLFLPTRWFVWCFWRTQFDGMPMHTLPNVLPVSHSFVATELGLNCLNSDIESAWTLGVPDVDGFQQEVHRG